MRRVDCLTCGIKVETIPWAQGKHTDCDVFRHFLAFWARLLSWKETACCFQINWDNVCRSVKWVVDFGLKHRDLEGITAIGFDEVTYSKGHRYMTLVYQIDGGCRRLLGVTRNRETSSLTGFFETLGAARCAKIKVVCSDMWKPYLSMSSPPCCPPRSISSTAYTSQRSSTRPSMKSAARKSGKSRFCFPKRPRYFTVGQAAKLGDLLKSDLKTVRAWMLKESFDAFWQYDSPRWAGWYIRKWCARAMRSQLEPTKKFVRTLRNHEELLMNYFKAGKHYNSGIVEGLNLRINICMRKTYGYSSFELLPITLFHTLGKLPEPKFTHRYC